MQVEHWDTIGECTTEEPASPNDDHPANEAMMDVRQVRPTDAPLLLALALDERAQLVERERAPVARAIAQTVLPPAMRGKAWVARGARGVGLLQAQPRQYVLGWDVTRLAVRGDVPEIVGPLMHAATVHLQSRGVPRLFARCSQETCETLTSLDFHVLAREYILVGPLSYRGQEGPLPDDSRYRMPQDAWPLHQLESETTPALVRQLEGLTSSDWSHAKRDMTEIVIERDGHLVGWLSWDAKGRHGYARLGLLVHPAYRDVGPQLIAHAIAQAPTALRFVSRIRDYQVETLRSLTDAGFDITGEETLMVKHAGVQAVRTTGSKLRVSALTTITGVHTNFVTSGAGIIYAVPPLTGQKEKTQ